MKTGQVLRAIRQRVGLSTTKLSAATGIPQSTISRWENGRNAPPLNAVRLLLDKLNATDAERLALLSHDPSSRAQDAPPAPVTREGGGGVPRRQLVSMRPDARGRAAGVVASLPTERPEGHAQGVNSAMYAIAIGVGLTGPEGRS